MRFRSFAFLTDSLAVNAESYGAIHNVKFHASAATLEGELIVRLPWVIRTEMAQGQGDGEALTLPIANP